MKIAQRLYEAGHITYMRTDQAVISEEATKDALHVVKTAYGIEYMDQRKCGNVNEETKQKQEKTLKKKTQQKQEKTEDCTDSRSCSIKHHVQETTT